MGRLQEGKTTNINYSMPKEFPFYKQHDAMDCGAACLRMVARHYGKFYALEYLRSLSHIDKEGVSVMGISDAAEAIGLHSLAMKLPYETLSEDVPLPCIAYWRQRHFVVVYKATKKHIWVADPANDLIKYTKEEFLDGWISDQEDGQEEGVLILLETTPDFYLQEDEELDRKSWSFLWAYFRPYKRLLFQLILGLIVGSCILLVFPFLMQAIVDFGIENQDINFIYLILIAHLILFFSQTAIQFIRSWILLHIGSRININLISDFLIKLVKLPVKFFDTKLQGDILQRINDHHRIETFLSTTSLSTLFSIVTTFIFALVLLYYNVFIFLIFLVCSIIYFYWVFFFLKRRRELDYKQFDKLSENQSSMAELISGMKEIKLHGAEKQKRWDWENIQASLFRINKESLAQAQYQVAGANFINELKNILISFFAAKSVIDGNMTLGMMVAVQYIIGQLNTPILQLMDFIRSAQDAKISLERLGEIHDQIDETEGGQKIDIIPEYSNLQLDSVSFRYGGPHSRLVLKNISLNIPQGKTTAIVGTSGSGKTTLLKLLLNFYQPTKGEVLLGGINLRNISDRIWRKQCGVVMQDGFIFSDSIAKNIALGEQYIDSARLLNAVRVANIQSFIESLPLSYNTKIGQDGMELSQGQKQRILIARAVYKQPEYIFFDEATNALDAYNEMFIMENLNDFFKNKTVVVVAHRLSTVKNADKIVVIESGEIVEQGTHHELTSMRGAYFYLVKNQLELGE